MKTELLQWDILEVTSSSSSLNGVMLRGRIRKFGIKNDINVLVENTQDRENSVRFAVVSDADGARISNYLKTIIKDVEVEPKLSGVINPVLSKLKVNIESRYTL